MDTITGIERAAIEARARRLAAAVIAVHQELDQRERRRGHLTEEGRAEIARLRQELEGRAQDLVVIGGLLPITHVQRIAAEHVCATVEAWAAEPLGTETARAGSLSMVIAMALLRRTLADDARAHRRAA